MPNLLLLDAEAKLESDQNGSYRTQLMEALNKSREYFAFARHGFLPPEEYEVAEGMEAALTAALAIIRDHKPADPHGTPDDEAPAPDNIGTMINV